MSVAEQRYEASRAVIAAGETVMDVAARFSVARKTVHSWLAKYEAGGLGGLADRTHHRIKIHRVSVTASACLEIFAQVLIPPRLGRSL
jgi:transposase-like protein